MKTIFPYLKDHLNLILLTLILATISQLFLLLDPLIFRYAIDNYAYKLNEYPLNDFLVEIFCLLLAIVGAGLASRITKGLKEYNISAISQKVGAQIYIDSLRHSLNLPYSIFENQKSGETLNLITTIRTDIEKLISAFVNIFFTSLVGFVFASIYTYKTHWMIGPVYLFSAPIICFVSFYLSKKVEVIKKQIISEHTALAGSTTESLKNIELIKILSLSTQEIRRLNLATNKLLNLELKKIKYVRSLAFVQSTIINLIRTSILFFILYLVHLQEITFGQFFSLYFYSYYITYPLEDLGMYIVTFGERKTSLNNFKKILDTEPETTCKNAVFLEPILALDFNNVSFSHKNSVRPALNNISFHATQGETIAFVGPSGSGKSTLTKLLVGLYQPSAGEILYNRINLNNINLASLRQQVGIVTQEALLFSGSIRDNLRFVKPEAKDEECLSALEKAACLELVTRSPHGLDSTIGEGGIKISGGEKQRLSIARAILNKPALLIFDEATSALDSATEIEINKTIQSVSRERSHIVIIVAHRLSTIMQADKIYVLERGEIVESGIHQNLIENKGLYYAMWRQQIGEGLQIN